MLGPRLPAREPLTAEATPTLQLAPLDFPQIVDGRERLGAAVELDEVLPQVVFPAECALGCGPFGT